MTLQWRNVTKRGNNLFILFTEFHIYFIGLILCLLYAAYINYEMLSYLNLNKADEFSKKMMLQIDLLSI